VAFEVAGELQSGDARRVTRLKFLPCPIWHKAEAFGSMTRKDRRLGEAARFFLGALQRAG
jgi:hypothetical protein